MGFDMHKDLPLLNIFNIDYSSVVIKNQFEKFKDQFNHEKLRFEVMDMMELSYENEKFDFVIDKATMDVLMTSRKDPWNPSEELIAQSLKLLKGNILRVLKPNGKFIQISWEQPHFRKMYLLHEEVKDLWEYELQKIEKGLEYFMYILTKK